MGDTLKNMIKLPKKELPKILSRSKDSEDKLFNVERLALRFSNGVEREYVRIQPHSPFSVLVVPMLDQDTLLLIREYGVGIEDYSLTFPKGGLALHEDPLKGANRELKEETGYGARSLKLVKTLSTSPSYTTARMHFVLATNLYECPMEGDEPEPLEVVPWKLSCIDELLQREDFHEGRSIAALLWVQRLLS